MNMNKKMLLTVLFLIAILAASAVTLALAGNGDPDVALFPPAKQTVVAIQTAVHATDLALPQAGKPQILQSFSLPASCPAPTQTTGIFQFRFGPFFGGKYLINSATMLASNGDYYTVWAGAPDDAPQKGLLRVDRTLGDSCQSYSLGTQAPPMADFITPNGPLTITRIQGDAVVYSIAGGGTGSFNFVTAQFTP
jgi:hypothetical protein